MSDPHYLSASDALRLFRTRELSPVELLTAVIARAEAVEPAINAFAETRYEEALELARSAQERYAGTGPPPRPLDGLPVAVKEEARSRARRTRWARCRCARRSPTTRPPSSSASSTPADNFRERPEITTPSGRRRRPAWFP